MKRLLNNYFFNVSSKIHELKCLPEYFKSIKDGTKTFEIRHNDRDFKDGDILKINEWYNDIYTGDSVLVIVTYVLGSNTFSIAIKDGYCVLGIKKLITENE